MKFRIIFCFSVIFLHALSGISQESSIIYGDLKGNIISIKDSSIFPSEIDINFLQKSLTSNHFGLEKEETKMHINISLNRKSKRRFILKVQKVPFTEDIQKTLEYLGGYQYYELKFIMKRGNPIGLNSNYLYATI